jgi:hypothetical protein
MKAYKWKLTSQVNVVNLKTDGGSTVKWRQYKQYEPKNNKFLGHNLSF